MSGMDYIAWAPQVADGARRVNGWLETVFDEAPRELEAILGDPTGRT